MALLDWVCMGCMFRGTLGCTEVTREAYFAVESGLIVGVGEAGKVEEEDT